MRDKCHFCEQTFKPEDFSTIFCFRADNIELLAHDDCLDIFYHNHEGENLIVELGHKIWGKNTDD